MPGVESRRASTLRAGLGVLLFLGTAGCGLIHSTSDLRAPGTPSSSASVTPPTAEVTSLRPVYAYQVDLQASQALYGNNAETVVRSAGPLRVADDGNNDPGFAEHEVVLVFRQPVSAACLSSAVLEVPVAASTGLAAADIRVYGSALFRAATGARTLTDTGTDLLGIDPEGSAVAAAAGLRADVTALYSLWKQGGPFDGYPGTFPADSPLLLTVRTGSYVDPAFSLSTSIDTVVLRVTAKPGCG